MGKAGNNNFRKVFSQRLRAYRLLARYDTARGFAFDLEEEENTYTRWERAETLPGIEQLLKICLRLGITPNQLIWIKPKSPQTIDADDEGMFEGL